MAGTFNKETVLPVPSHLVRNLKNPTVNIIKAFSEFTQGAEVYVFSD